MYASKRGLLTRTLCARSALVEEAALLNLNFQELVDEKMIVGTPAQYGQLVGKTAQFVTACNASDSCLDIFPGGVRAQTRVCVQTRCFVRKRIPIANRACPTPSICDTSRCRTREPSRSSRESCFYTFASALLRSRAWSKSKESWCPGRLCGHFDGVHTTAAKGWWGEGPGV